jgi:hypothetical protein
LSHWPRRLPRTAREASAGWMASQLRFGISPRSKWR